MIQTDVIHPQTKEAILTEETLRSVLGEKNIKRWAYVLHDGDMTENETGEMVKRAPHWHVCVWLNSASSHSAVAKWFGVPENFVEHEKTSWEAMITYLTHELEPDKHRYQDELIKVNPGYEWTADRDAFLKRRAERVTKEELDELYRQCADGTIREYDHHKHIPPLVFIKNERLFKQAFHYYLDNMAWKSLKPKRIMFITGLSGSGKTKLATTIAEESGEKPFLISGGADALDGYKGERIVVFDDFRGADWHVEQLLKLTDPYTSTRLWSRFKSKSLAAAETIIFTFPSDEGMKRIEKIIYTPPELKRFFTHFKGHETEPIKQWYRRVEVFTRVVNREITKEDGARTAYFYAKVNPADPDEGWEMLGTREDIYKIIAEQLNTNDFLVGMGATLQPKTKLPANWKDDVLAGTEENGVATV